MTNFEDAYLIIAAYFNELVNRLGTGLNPKELPELNRVIYYVVVVRCEIDQSGFESVFEQALNEEEVLFLISALQDLDEPRLAECLGRAHQILRQADFFIRPRNLCEEDEPELCRISMRSERWSQKTILYGGWMPN